MSKQTIELSDDAIAMFGSDLSHAIEIAALIFAAGVRDLESYFTPHEWRAVAHAIGTATFPTDRNLGKRMVYEIEDYDDTYNLAHTCNVVVADVLTKVHGLTSSQLWCVLATVQFAVAHVPTRLDAEEWWTLSFRRAQVVVPNEPPKKRPPRRQEKSQEKEKSHLTMTEGDSALADQPLTTGS